MSEVITPFLVCTLNFAAAAVCLVLPVGLLQTCLLNFQFLQKNKKIRIYSTLYIIS